MFEPPAARVDLMPPETAQFWFPDLPIALRVGTFFGAWILLWCPWAIPLGWQFQWRPFQPLMPSQKLRLVSSLYLLVPLLLWQTARLEGIPLASYGLTWNLALLVSLAIGLGLALLGCCLLVGLPLALGWCRWQSAQLGVWGRSLLPILLLALFIGWIEEWVFRGFLLNQFLTVTPVWGAALGSSLMFALLHLVWEGKTIVPQLPGLWFMGMVLCLARGVDNGSLGMAWGLHTGWVWGIASLDLAQILTPTGAAPVWLLGMDGKPLAGLLGLLLLLVTGGLLFLMF